jgi:saccharopine dehydrogenase (NAD+, L-lysine-forming)
VRIAILGGYGNAGRAVAELLAAHTAADLLLLGRNAERAREAAAAIAARTGRAVSGAGADAHDPAALQRALAGSDLTLVASSTLKHTAEVAAAVLVAGADWFDIGLSSAAKLAALRALEPRIRAQGRCFVTDGGVHPGVPGGLVRRAALQGPLASALVAGCFEVCWRRLRFSPGTLREFVEEILDYDPSIFRDGRWRRSSRQTRRFDFGAPFGPRTCVPMGMEEVRELPAAIPTLRETGFFIAGFGPIVDWLAMPVAFALARASRTGLAARLLSWSLVRFASGTRGAVVLLEAGYEDGTRSCIRLSHRDPYVLTAAPVVAALLQYAGGHRPSGLWTQAAFVEPVRFLADLERLGVAVTEA